MPRKTPVRELQKEEVVPSSPLRRSTRLSNSSPVPTKVLTRRNSATEAATSTPKATRGRRSSLSQETESTEDASEKKKPVSTVRTRRSSLTQNNEEPPKEEPKTRATRGSSVSKESVEVKKTTRRRKSVTEEPEVAEEESNKKISRSRSGSLSKKVDETSEKTDSVSTPVKKAPADNSSSEIMEETQKGTESPAVAPKQRRRNTEVIKIDMDLSVINEASLTEEEMSPPKKNKIQEEAAAEMKVDSNDTQNVLKETEKPPESEEKLENIKTNSGKKNHDSSMSDTSFNLQLSSSALENSKNEVDGKDASNKENVCPQASSVEEPECEPMEVDAEFDQISPVKSKPKVPYVALAKTVNEIEKKLKDDEKLAEEIDQFLSEEVATSKNEETNLKIESVVVTAPTGESNKDLGPESIKNKEKVVESPIKNVNLGDEGNKNEEKLERSLETEKKLTPSKEKESVKEKENKEPEIVEELAPEENDASKNETDLHIPANMEAPEEAATEKVNVDTEKESHLTEKLLESPKIVITEETDSTKESDSLQETKGKEKENDEESFSVDVNEADGTESETCATRGTSVAEEISTPLTNQSFQDSGNEDVIDVEIFEENNKTDICDNGETVDGLENKNGEVEVVEEEIEKVTDHTVPDVDESCVTDLEVKKINENVDAPEKKSTEEINLCDSDSDNEDRANKSYKRTSVYSVSDDEVISKEDKDKQEKPVFDKSIDWLLCDSRNETKMEPSTVSDNEVIELSENESEKQDENYVDDRVNTNDKTDEIVENKETEEKETTLDTSKLSRSLRKRSLDTSTITLQETIKAEENKEGVSGRIHRVVDLFCAGIKNKSDISINVSLEYTGQLSDSEDETEKINISLTAVDLKEALTEPTKGSKRRKICHTGIENTSPVKSYSENHESVVEANESLKSSPKVSSSVKKSRTRKSLVDSEIEDSATNVTNASPKTSPSDDQEKVKSAQKRRSKVDSEPSSEIMKTAQVTPSKSSSQQDTEESDDDVEESSDEESNNDEYYSNILAKSFEENEANDVSYRPDTESAPTDSESEDSDDSDEEDDVDETMIENSPLKRKSNSFGDDYVFVTSVEQKKTTPVRKNKSEPENKHSKSPSKENVDAEVSSSAKKTKNRRSGVETTANDDNKDVDVEVSSSAKKTKKRRSGIENAANDDENVIEEEKIKSSAKKDKKRKSQVESEFIEESTARAPVTSPLKKLTPSKTSKKIEPEENPSDSESSSSDEFEDSVYYKNLLSRTFEENEEDVTWKRSSDEESDDTDDEETEEIETENESPLKTQKEIEETSDSSNDEVFEDSTVQKPKKRKLFRLSTYTMQPVSSSNASEDMNEDKEQKPKSGKKQKQEEPKSNGTVEQQEKPKAKKKKQPKDKFFSQSKNTENMVPETSEVQEPIPKGKKRKHVKPLSSSSDTDNCTVQTKFKIGESASIKKFQEQSKNKGDFPSVIKPSSGNVKNVKPSCIKPSTKSIAGWEVTKMF